MLACLGANARSLSGYRGAMTSTPASFPEDAELAKLHDLTEADIQSPEESLLEGILPHPTPTEAIGSVHWNKPFTESHDTK